MKPECTERKKPTVLLISTGGTITMTPGSHGGVSPTLSGEDLVKAVPELAHYANLSVYSYSTKPGASLTCNDMRAIASYIDSALNTDVAGAVVVQGTDTIEETAYLLDLLVQSDKPVVVTGAMRSAAMPGADGAANLLSSVIVATSECCNNLGTLVVLDDEIHRARFVQKTDSAATGTFKSPGAAPAGRVLENTVVLFGRFSRTKPIVCTHSIDENAVAIVKVALGDDGRMLRSIAAMGYKAVIIESMGAGHLPAHYPDIISEVLGTMPVVLGTRVPGGSIFHKTYNFPGSEMDTLGRGALSAGTLGVLRTRLLLTVLISSGKIGAELTAEFLARV